MIRLIVTLLLLSRNVYSAEKTNILFIGDSQTEGYLGEIVYNYLKKSPYVKNVNVYGVGSSSPRHWQQNITTKYSKWLQKRTARLNDGRYKMNGAMKPNSNQSLFMTLNQRHNPDLVVFQFLGNSMMMSKNFIINNVRGLLSQLKDSQECIYISSPPYYMDMPEKNQKRAETQEYFLEAIGSRCRVLKGINEDSLRNFATKREYFIKDKIHLTRDGAQEFFKLVQLYLP